MELKCTMIRAIAICSAFVVLAGCASKSSQRVDKVSYEIGQEQVAVLGVPFLSEERGNIVHGKQWEGILWGGMHHSYTKSPDYRLTELYYGGMDGGEAVVVLQELTGNNSSPTRNTYSLDLSQEDTFQVGRYQLQVISAKPNGMRFRVLSD